MTMKAELMHFLVTPGAELQQHVAAWASRTYNNQTVQRRVLPFVSRRTS